MKLQLIGHNEKYALEQSLLTLFPGERPVYGEVAPEDARWAIVTMHDRGAQVEFVTEIGYDGKTARCAYAYPLSGNDYEREGQRRHALGLSFFGAAKDALGVTPPWGSLTGVRPTKVALALLKDGGREYADRELAETYAVTPERRRLAIEAAEAGQRAAAALRPDEISLYVGIPFCPTRCAYCSFVAQSVEKAFAMVEPYLDALCAEIAAAGEMVRETGLRIKSFYMGGGTPTTLTAEQMDRLLTALENHFDFANLAELTIEAGRPDTITADKLAVLKAHTVTRLSVNPQSMNDRVLTAIGRRHTADDIRRAMALVKDAGFPHVNMDLIAGLSEDTPESFRASLRECLIMGADNITVHTLSLKKGSRITLEGTHIPSGEDVAQMLDYANATLRKHGYAPYYLYRQKYMSGSFENVGWSLPGAESLYNIYIMEELHGILSLGAGGSTKMVGRSEGGEAVIRRAFNAKYPKEYIERSEKWRANLAAFAEFYRKGSH
ncbi:MAG: coproporphyrinogen dehydrogenase HemZ [Oscillospiraceae bacterium]|nr:coproporphyrinogen dehydrogenase HemZ [Oscillospiraceae bacterium]